MDSLALALLTVPPLIVAIILHEVAHGVAAEWLGDPTARQLGRITINPIPHIDPMMTLIVPIGLILAGSPILFGGAKPVPVNPRYFKNPRQGMMIVAAAGPAINIVLAFTCVAILKLLFGSESGGGSSSLVPAFIQGLLYHGVIINVVLAVFNMIPIPPLDGGRIMVGLLPLPLAEKYAQLEPYGLFILVALLMTGTISAILHPVLSATVSLLLGIL